MQCKSGHFNPYLYRIFNDTTTALPSEKRKMLGKHWINVYEEKRYSIFFLYPPFHKPVKLIWYSSIGKLSNFPAKHGCIIFRSDYNSCVLKHIERKAEGVWIATANLHSKHRLYCITVKHYREFIHVNLTSVVPKISVPAVVWVPWNCCGGAHLLWAIIIAQRAYIFRQWIVTHFPQRMFLFSILE